MDYPNKYSCCANLKHKSCIQIVETIISFEKSLQNEFHLANLNKLMSLCNFKSVIEIALP